LLDALLNELERLIARAFRSEMGKPLREAGEGTVLEKIGAEGITRAHVNKYLRIPENRIFPGQPQNVSGHALWAIEEWLE